MTKMDRWLSWGKTAFGPILLVFTFVVYLLTLARDAVVGEPARLIVQHTGLDPFPPLSHFLWGWLAQSVSIFTGSYSILFLNFLSAVFGSLSIYFLYEIVVRMPHDRTAEEVESRFPAAPVQAISALVAALVLAFCMPFWIISTRAHTASFDVFLLLFVTWILIRFLETKRFAWLWSFAFLYGLGATEFPTFIVLSPVYALAVLYAIWCAVRDARKMIKPILVGILLSVAGLLPYILGAIQYRWSPAFEWREFRGLHEVLFYVLRDQYLTIRYSLPQVGWLLVFLLSILPWIVVVVSPKRAMTRSAVAGSNFLHALLSALAILIIYNMGLAPWPLLGMRPLLIMPYVFIAMWTGYLAGYWYIFFGQRSRFEAHGPATLKALASTIYVPVLLAIVLLGGALNARGANGRTAGVLNRFASEVLQAMGPRDWFISNGVLDDVLLLKAREQGKDIKLLNMSRAATKSYRKYIATLYDDPRLQGLVQVGIMPMITEWLSKDPSAHDRIAVLDQPDLWFMNGYTPVPQKVLFVGATNGAPTNAEALFKEHQAFWNDYAPRLKRAGGKNTPIQPWARWTLNHISKLANNLGVLMEDENRSDLAVESYRAARSLDTNNISALLNLLSLAQREKQPELKDLQTEFEKMMKTSRGRLNLWTLAQSCGYVRAPEAFSARGMAWAMTGKPGVGIREIQKAVRLGAGSERADLTMASFYLMQDMNDESESLYDAVLEKSPDNLSALAGKLRIALRKKDFTTAASYIDHLRQMGAPAGYVDVEDAKLNALEGNTEAATEILLKVVADQPKNLRAWTMLALVAKDKKVVDRATSTLAAAESAPPQILLTLAEVARSRGDRKGARGYLDRLVRASPNNTYALERLLELDVEEAKRESAELNIERLLKIDPRNAFANYILGTIQFARGDTVLAESSYRTCLEERQFPQAMNDLAWILQARGQYDEALSFVNKAIEVDRLAPFYWDTLGVIRMKMGQLDQAQEAFQTALGMQAGHPEIILHMAQLYERKGMKNEALKLADPLLSRPTQMSPSAYDELRALVRNLRGT